MRFNGQTIFGQISQRQSGPFPTTRTLREKLPGVTGYRIYKLAGSKMDTRVWTVEGRIIASSLAQLETVIDAGQTYLDGNVYTFHTTGGLLFDNCELTDYRPRPPYQRIIWNGVPYVTTIVTGTIEQASP